MAAANMASRNDAPNLPMGRDLIAILLPGPSNFASEILLAAT